MNESDWNSNISGMTQDGTRMRLQCGIWVVHAEMGEHLGHSKNLWIFWSYIIAFWLIRIKEASMPCLRKDQLTPLS
jgi:hypothetical protein